MSLCMMVSPSWLNRFQASDSSSDFAIRTEVSKPSPDDLTKQSIKQAYNKLPLRFIENRGQADSRVAYYAQDGSTGIYFTSEGITISLSADLPASGSQNPLTSASTFPAARSKAARHTRAKQRWALKLDFVGSNRDVKPKGIDQSPSVVSYFKGSQSKSRVPTYAGLIYENLWPDIDLLYAGASNRLKYTFIVKPGGDVNQIKMACRGATAARVSREGRLQVDTPLGGIEDDKPYSYQDTDDQRVGVAMRYEIEREADDYVYGFRPGSYDAGKTLVIDPVVLVYSGYVGGSKDDVGSDIAVDSNHNAYITGNTRSGARTFPVTAGPDLIYNGGDSDAFVAKINPEGDGLIYCAYIGGDGSDEAVGIAVDGAGNAYVFGDTDSNQSTFPVKVGPDLTFNKGLDTFVAKIDPTGGNLIYCGYIGGSECDSAGGIGVDGAGNAYVFGDTASKESSFPVTVGPDLTLNGPRTGCEEDDSDDTFVAKVSASGTSLLYCGYIGGARSDEAAFGGIAVDNAGSAYVTGRTRSTESDFPVTVGPDLTYNGGRFDVFVAKVSVTGEALDYCGYIGGSGSDGGGGCDIAVDRAGNAYVIGDTTSPQPTFPLAVGPDLRKDGRQIVFVAKINASGEALDYCGYIEGNADGESSPGGIAVDNDGNAYVFGDTTATETSFPLALGPDLTFNGGDFDAFVAKVNPAGTSLIYCGYVGGDHADFADEGGIGVDDAGNAYVIGATSSKADSFPVRVGPGLEYMNAGDVFVTKIAFDQEFSLKFSEQNIRVGRGESASLKIRVERDPGFSGVVTVKPLSLDEKGIKITPAEPVEVSEDGVKFKLKIKSGAERTTRRLFFSGRSASGVEHTGVVIVKIAK
ncbi:MAG TPA: SBBP repeat-containing protein [Blastocatellia bacterium]|nr:SBBP repeat-containing protein [Blastocatellia bacterium]